MNRNYSINNLDLGPIFGMLIFISFVLPIIGITALLIFAFGYISIFTITSNFIAGIISGFILVFSAVIYFIYLIKKKN